MEANVAIPAALIGDPVRAAMLLALLDDRSMPATALAWVAGVSAQAASNHLAKLMAGGLLQVTAQGRHRYYRSGRAASGACVGSPGGAGAASAHAGAPA